MFDIIYSFSSLVKFSDFILVKSVLRLGIFSKQNLCGLFIYSNLHTLKVDMTLTTFNNPSNTSEYECKILFS